MSSRVVCINPPGLPGTTANREGAGGMGAVVPGPRGFLYPPHTLASVAGALRADGLDVAARDCVLEGDGFAQAAAWIGAQSPDWLVVQLSWATREADVAFLRDVREAVPAAAIVAVGASVPWMEDDLAQTSGIAWLHGEPERLLGLFVAGLGADPSRWRGLLLPSPAQTEQMEGLPHPAWDLLPWCGYRMLTVVGSKGCNHACAYCPYVVAQGRRFRPRPVAEIVDEMAHLAKVFGPQRLVFRDPVFAHDRERVLALCRDLNRRGVRVPWECESRADDLDAEMVAAMAKAGCTTVKLGLESADTDVLVSVGRCRDAASAEIYLRRALDTAVACRRHGIACRIFAMTGLAGETEESINRTIGFLHEMQPSALTVKAADWYPGTRMERQMDAATAESRARRMSDSWKPLPAMPQSGLWARVKRRMAR